MNTTVEIQGKPLVIETSTRAQQALRDRNRPLLAEMQLYFSCMIVKHVCFTDMDNVHGNSIKVADMLAVRFRPVMRETCTFDKILQTPKTDMDVPHPENFVPKWLKIDYTRDGWTGEFGY